VANTKAIDSPSTQNDKSSKDTTMVHSANKSWSEMIKDKECSLHDYNIIGTAGVMN